MQRFQNPHQYGGHMQQHNQIHPQFQHQQQQPNSGIIQLPNGMFMLPNGTVLTPQQLQAMSNMNPQMGSMSPHSLNMPSSRFSNTNQTISGNISGTPMLDNDFNNYGRFQPINQQNKNQLSDQQQRFRETNNQIGSMMDQQNISKETPETFVISVSKGVKFNNNSKVVLSNYYEELKESQLGIRENNLTIVDCFEEAVELCISYSHIENTGKLAYVGDFLIENSFYKAADQEQFNKLILDNDIKSMYKAVKTAWPTLTNKYDIFMFDKFDSIITDTINDFIAVNCPVKISIDSFMTDFNELLKILRGVDDLDLDLEDELITHMNRFISNIKTNLEINQSQLSGIDAEDGKKVTYIPEQFTIGYIDKYSYELGITNAPSELVAVEDNNDLNKFILSTARTVMSKQEVDTIYMVSIDKVVIQLVKSLNDVIFIKKL